MQFIFDVLDWDGSRKMIYGELTDLLGFRYLVYL